MAILARDVRRTYGDVVALDGVSLDVAAGEVYALVGPNGAGKTTLVRALSGTTAATGRIEVFDRPPAAVDPARVGLLPQSFEPPERLTPRELVRYYGGLYDESRPPDAVLEDVGLEARDVRYDRLSGGQRRRTCVAVALVNDPDLLFLDEPTTGIDPAGRRSLLSLLEEFAAGGTAILLTTHYMAEAERLADRVGLLADGRLVAEGTPASLVEAYGGPSRLTIDAGGGAARALREAGHAVTDEGDRVTVRDVAPTAVGDVVDTLETAEIAYDELTWRQPDLEDVYLSLAGTATAARADQRGSADPERPERGREVDA